MRTSIELPDALFRRAKLVALERRTTLKALVASGLEKELGLTPGAGSSRLTKPPIRLTDDSPLFESPLIDDSGSENDEATKLNEVYRRR
jgi:hypothetical protein